MKDRIMTISELKTYDFIAYNLAVRNRAISGRRLDVDSLFSAFTWEGTEEGHNYWSGLHFKRKTGSFNPLKIINYE